MKNKFKTALWRDQNFIRLRVFLILSILTILYLQINELQGAMKIIENASIRLSEIDMNLTSTMLNMSLIQINDLLESETVDPTLNLGIARNIIQDLMFGLDNKSDHVRVPLDNTDLCSDHPIDCVIGRLQFTLESLNRGDYRGAKDTLNSIFGSLE